MKRIVIIAVLLVLSLVGTASAAGSAMHVLLNGKEVQLPGGATYDGTNANFNTNELLRAMGVELAWDPATLTMSVTDKTLSENDTLKAQLNAVKGDLAAVQSALAKATANQATTTSALYVNKENLVFYLNQNFALYSDDKYTLHVTWEQIGDKFFAEIADADFMSKYEHGLRVITWFDRAAQVIARVYPSGSSAMLLDYVQYSSYPTGNHDSVRYVSGKYSGSTYYPGYWSVIDNYIFATTENGKADTQWIDHDF